MHDITLITKTQDEEAANAAAAASPGNRLTTEAGAQLTTEQGYFLVKD